MNGHCLYLYAMLSTLWPAYCATAADQAEAESNETVEVEITIKSRNAAPLLASVIKTLSDLSKKPHFYDALSTQGSATPEEKKCLETVRSDSSGRVFDSARCLGVWPDASKASLPAKFAKEFSRAVSDGVLTAFPPIQVTPFEFLLRLQSNQFPRVQGGNFERQGDLLAPTAAFRRVLCNPNVTFIEEAKCGVIVVNRYGMYPDDIYVSQTGYRLRILNKLSPDTAARLSREFFEQFMSPNNSPIGAVSVALKRPESPLPEEKISGENKGIASSRSDVEKLWKLLGVDATRISIIGRNADPPSLLLFDSNDDGDPLHITDWLKELKSLDQPKAPADCTEFSSEHWHREAVASLIFPGSLLGGSHGKDAGSTTSDLPQEGWNGFFLGAGHFRGSVPVGDLRWYEKGLLGAPENPVIGLIVYSRQYGKTDLGTAKTAAETFLSDASTLLVVAAPQRENVPAAFEFSGNVDPKTDGRSLEQACEGRAWPACLGRHPRVLVVASSDFPEESGPVLAAPDSYLLGESTVRAVAPGANVPIFKRCAGEGAPSWSIDRASGTSYSAAIVALLLSRLIQIGPESMRRGFPEAAIWRLLASTRSLMPNDGVATPVTEFGRVDAKLALIGASTDEIGEHGASTVYPLDLAGDALPTQAVVMPYPWNDQPANLGGPVSFVKLRTSKRNFITYAQPSENRVETLEFSRLLRIKRRIGESVNGSPLFDMFYISENVAGKPRSVILRKGVRFGSGEYVESPGYCRYDGIVVPDSANATPQNQAQPACLYAWMAGSDGFAPMDLRTIKDIIFPPLHFESNWPGNVSPADLRMVVQSGSPWATTFCSTGPRIGAKDVLRKLKQPERESLCN